MAKKKTGQIIECNIDDLMKEAFIDYTFSNIKRSIPGLIDGLKPVQRRIIWTLYVDKVFGLTKSARIVGAVIGRFNPHGDISAYKAMVKLTQEWKSGITLVDFQGNKGSIEGDEEASMRYTEAMMSEFTKDVILSHVEDLPMMKNYDEKEFEPEYFVPAIPLILINGSEGIATGIATSIPPHNINEVIDASIEYISTKSTTKALTKIKGPDFPTGGLIEANHILKGARTGTGVVLSYPTYDVEIGKYGIPHIVLNEMPFQTTTDLMISKLKKLLNDKKDNMVKEHVTNFINETSSEGVRIRIVMKRTSTEKDAHDLFEYLKNTEVISKKIKYSMRALTPTENYAHKRGVSDIIEEWYLERKHLKERYFDRVIKETKESIRRLTIKYRFVINYEKISKIIHDNKNDERIFSAVSKFIPELERHDLSFLYGITINTIKNGGEKISSEVQEKKDLIETLLYEQTIIDEILIEELKSIKKKYGRKRFTKIV